MLLHKEDTSNHPFKHIERQVAPFAYLALLLCSFLCVFLKACDLLRLLTLTMENKTKQNEKISAILMSLIKFTSKPPLARYQRASRLMRTCTIFLSIFLFLKPLLLRLSLERERERGEREQAREWWLKRTTRSQKTAKIKSLRKANHSDGVDGVHSSAVAAIVPFHKISQKQKHKKSHIIGL